MDITKDIKDSKLKIKYILEQQEKLTRKEIAMKMGYDKPSRITDLMKRNGYVLVNNKFVLKEKNQDGKRVAKDTHIKNNNIQVVGDSSHILGVQDKNIQDKLFNMIDKYDTFMKIIDMYENNRWQVGDDSHIIEISTGMQITYEETKTIKTSIRIEKEIWEAFKELGENKYKHISNTKLISQAVHEFIEKYK